MKPRSLEEIGRKYGDLIITGQEGSYHRSIHNSITGTVKDSKVETLLFNADCKCGQEVKNIDIATIKKSSKYRRCNDCVYLRSIK